MYVLVAASFRLADPDERHVKPHSQKFPRAHRPTDTPQPRPARAGQIVVRPELAFNGLKVFSASMRDHRLGLGDAVTAWIAAHKNLRIVDITVTQSSDAEFHCLTITVGYWEQELKS